MKMRAISKAMPTVAVFVTITVLIILAGAYLNLANNGATSTTTSSTGPTSEIQGVVTGYVTVGPSQPVCTVGQACNVNMSGYEIVFTSQCQQAANSCPVSMAPLSPAGHYSILLSPGTYSVTGLYPSCKWLGCASAFPKTVTVEGGVQLVVNFVIDTGIR